MARRIPLKLRLRFHWWYLRYGRDRALAMIRQKGYEDGYDAGFLRGISGEDLPPRDE